MRTREQAKRAREPSGSENVVKGFHGSKSRDPMKSQDVNGTLTDISEEALERFLKRGSSRKASCVMVQAGSLCHGKSNDMVVEGNKEIDRQKAEELISKAVVAGRDAKEIKPVMQDTEGIDHDGFSAKTEETDWIDGSVSISDIGEDHPNNLERELTIEFSESQSFTKRKVRRASIEDKRLAELVHKVHLLCLLGRGRLVDRACDDPLIQASLLSLIPTCLLNTIKGPELKANALTSLVNWFHRNFHVRLTSSSERSVMSSLSFALETHEGSAEEIAALSVALFRALNLTARFVSILDVASLKPATDMSECSNTDMNKVDTRIFSKGVANLNQVSAVYPGQFSSHETNNIGGIGHEAPHRCNQQTGGSDLICKTNKHKCLPVNSQMNNQPSDSIASKCNDNNNILVAKHDKGPKRKGDIEFELHIEMALSATATTTRALDSSLGLDSEGADSSSPLVTSPFQIAKKAKTKDSPVSTHDNFGAVWSRKVGPPMYWAEIFCNGDDSTGRWVHVDAANAIVDSEQKVEAAAAACRRPLRYVVAFAGNGAKDVTRRYCMKWYTIASQRVNSQWWDQVLAPLKQLESGATGGVVPLEMQLENGSSEPEKLKAVKVSDPLESYPVETAGNSSVQEHLLDAVSLTQGLDLGAPKPLGMNAGGKSLIQNPGRASISSLEDMELDTKALTEPLPTNQLAYKNHHLYAIERWLTKYQILHPKGPILGYCSGHPVYPRTCVQTLQTKYRWLREGLQVKEYESPAKVVKCSQKLKLASISKEDDSEGTIELYGKWQLEPLQLPHAVNGIVPKNERGQVDVWSVKCLPPGTVHLRLPRLVPVVKRLEIDFAPAMVGFEFRNGRSFPVFEGIVVCTECKDAILEAYAEEEERREAHEKKQNESQALSRWYQLLSNMVTRQRLKNSYEGGSTSQALQNILHQDGHSGSDLVSDEPHQECVQDNVRSALEYLPEAFAVDHEHVFPIENQSFDKESSIRTKRCRCGFSLQVEEM